MTRPLITVNMLQAQARDAGAVTLPDNALVTPAARDWLHGARVPVKHTDAVASANPTGATVFLVGDERDATVQTLLPSMQREHAKLRFHPTGGRLESLLASLKFIATDLAACDKRHAVALVDCAAALLCVANKFCAVRAITARTRGALQQQMQVLCPNMLVIETGAVALQQAQALIGAFLRSHAALDPHVKSVMEFAQPDGDGARCPCLCHF